MGPCGGSWGKKLGLGILSKALGLPTIAAITAGEVPQTGKGLGTQPAETAGQLLRALLKPGGEKASGGGLLLG